MSVIQNTNLFSNFLLLLFLLHPVQSVAQQRVELEIERINPFVFGKRYDPSIMVADLKGKYLREVMLSDIQGEVNLQIYVCNKTDRTAKVEVSAALHGNNGDLVWKDETKFDFPANNCQSVIGFSVYKDNDPPNYLKTMDLQFPIMLVIEFSEE